MSKILIIGDLHGRKQTQDVFTDVLDKAARIATKCDLTVLLGDINDTKANIRSEIQRILMDKLAKWPTKVVVMVGNHDYDNAIECEGHSLEALKLLSNVIVTDYTHIGGKMTFMPYLTEDRFLAELEKTPDTDLLFLHQDIDTAMYSNQMPVPSRIKAEMFKRFKRVFVGHIHLPQEFANIIYVGTPYTESYKESDEKKRVIVYDTDTDKVMSIPLGVRQHVTFKYKLDKFEDVKAIKEDIKSRIKPNLLVRVVIEVPEEIEHKIRKSLFKDVGIDKLKTKKIINTNKKLQIVDTMTNIEMMKTYLTQLSLDDKVKIKVNDWNSQILSEI